MAKPCILTTEELDPLFFDDAYKAKCDEIQKSFTKVGFILLKLSPKDLAILEKKYEEDAEYFSRYREITINPFRTR